MANLLFFEKGNLKVFFVLYEGQILEAIYHILSQFHAQHTCFFFFNKGKWSCSLLEDKKNVKFEGI